MCMCKAISWCSSTWCSTRPFCSSADRSRWAHPIAPKKSWLNTATHFLWHCTCQINLQHLQHRTTMWTALKYCLDVFRVVNGAHFKLSRFITIILAMDPVEVWMLAVTRRFSSKCQYSMVHIAIAISSFFYTYKNVCSVAMGNSDFKLQVLCSFTICTPEFFLSYPE